ncbi:MAG TPA: large conductance mechanosensitive channel protein MscL [Pseudonocardiaceae bacterium]|jgi:large conductance mechanosensitive channel|nr:large conductance mechanosensitive channel protein MscL [Pseudonocardiaceae bacterium]
MFKGFKDFLMRGNVIDLAVAVVMGTAFTAVVTAVVTNLLNPLIASIGGSNIHGLSYTINGKNPKTTMQFDAILTAAINFVIIAALLYFVVVLPVKKIQERRKRGIEPGPSEPTDVELLTEIRDLLREQRQPSGRPQGPTRPSGPAGPSGPYPGR